MTSVNTVVTRVSVDFNKELLRIKKLYGYKTTAEASKKVYKLIKVKNDEIFKM